MIDMLEGIEMIDTLEGTDNDWHIRRDKNNDWHIRRDR